MADRRSKGISKHEHRRFPIAGTVNEVRFPAGYAVCPRRSKHRDHLGYAGQVASVMQIGDDLLALPNGLTPKMVGVDAPDDSIKEAFPPVPVTMHPADELDSSSGDMICRKGNHHRGGPRHRLRGQPSLYDIDGGESVVVAWIVAFNSSAFIADCLHAIRPWVQRAYVLENGSSIEERKRIARIVSEERDWVQLLVSPRNLGFGAGMNFIRRHSEYAGSEVLWLVNPDIVAVQGTPEVAIAALERREVQVVSPCVVSTVGAIETVMFSGGHIDVRSGLAVHRDFGRPLSALNDAVGLESTDFVTGAAPLMLVRTWDALGGFREDLFMYWEDVDLSLRATQAGMKLAVDMGFRVSHVTGGSAVEASARKSDLFYFYTSRGRVIVCGERSSLTSVLLWPGGIHSIRLVIRPIVHETSRRFIKSGKVIAGLISGLHAVLASRANQEGQEKLTKRLRRARNARGGDWRVDDCAN